MAADLIDPPQMFTGTVRSESVPVRPSVWAEIDTAQESTKKQRMTLYSFQVYTKKAVKQMSRAEASSAIEFCLKLFDGTLR